MQKAQPGFWIYTITDHPKDYPEDFVVRRRLITPDPSTPLAPDPGWIMVSSEIEMIRDYLRRQGLTCLGREYGDDPVIVESWI